MKHSLAFAAGSILAFSVAAHATTYSDSTFNLANYTQTTTFVSGLTYTPSQCAACGNPGSALQLAFAFNSTIAYDYFAGGFVNNTFTYNPATQGAIISLFASADKDVTLTGSVSSFGNTFRPLIEQNGLYYLAGISGNTITTGATGGTTGFITLSGTLVATDFTQFDFATDTYGTANPDFSGGPITFGLAQSVQYCCVPSGDTILYDNYQIAITSAAPTPEPSSFVLLGTGITGLVGLLRRRRK